MKHSRRARPSPLRLGLWTAALAWSVFPAARAAPVSVGGEFPADQSTTQASRNVDVAMDADGDFVVVWDSFGPLNSVGASGRRFNAAGAPEGDEFRIADYPVGQAGRPSVAMDGRGNFTVAWSQFSGPDVVILARQYDRDGKARGDAFQVSSGGLYSIVPGIAMDVDGDFAIAWEDYDGADIWGRAFDRNGVARGPEFPVSPPSLVRRDYPDIAMARDGSGDFMIVWHTYAGDSLDVHGRRFSKLGVARDDAFPINESGTNGATPAIASDGFGRYVVTWQAASADDDYGIVARRYSRAGKALGGVFQVNTVTTGTQELPSITTDAVGDFVIAWDGYPGGRDRYGAARRFAPNGTPDGDEFILHKESTNYYEFTSVAMDADGDFVAFGESQEFDVEVFQPHVLGRRFRTDTPVDLSVDLADRPVNVREGSSGTYVLRVDNLTSPQAPTGVALLDEAIGAGAGIRIAQQFPANVTSVTTRGRSWTCEVALPDLACDYHAAVSPARSSSELIVEYQHAATEGDTLTSTAQLTLDQDDPQATNNEAEEQTPVICPLSALRFSQPDYSADEGAGTRTINVVREGGLCTPASVRTNAAGTTATEDHDFTFVDGVLEWGAGDGSPRTVDVQLVDDSLDEPSELVRLRLLRPSDATVGEDSLLKIVDNDPVPIANFTIDRQRVSESRASVGVTAFLSGQSARTITIPLQFSGTADQGTDYTPRRDSLTIKPGQTQAIVILDIADDAKVEKNETIVVQMGNVEGAVKGGLGSTEILIRDDDEPPPPPP